MLLKQGTHTSDAARDARSEMGVWLKSLREQQGMSQRDLANTLNLDYYTFISQLENGRGRIPPARYRDWATALQVEPTSFVKKLLSYNEPLTYEILFGDAG
ncbi:helix-turn-helix domain-containing protein [Phaeobacter italicus]|jgi:transcriptional regulator with XRE-family HTH domain|uniref:helix-turn-helix domain-containing protein n=2 Tax=Phaeobacter italicus TaxID=481446 RepID=UPI001ADA2595|nr:helix-turn-helix transcriptional regulator [Phaeobacter italicus]